MPGVAPLEYRRRNAVLVAIEPTRLSSRSSTRTRSQSLARAYRGSSITRSIANRTIFPRRRITAVSSACVSIRGRQR
jgi:hypothetical protein